MLTCIARPKQPSADEQPPAEKPSSNVTPTKQAIKVLSSQIKDMALKASGACGPCATHLEAQNGRYGGGATDLDKSRWSYGRAGSSGSTAGRRQLEARLKGISSGEWTPASASGRRVDSVVFVEESEPKEWVAQVDPGVLITFMSLPRGGNDLKQIKFSREMFNKWKAQKWWTENCEKVRELYNVQGLNQQAFPRSEEETSSPPAGVGDRYSSSDSLDQRTMQSKSEWVEQDEPGVYITIRALPRGRREIRGVRFSRDKFGEMHAKVWWEENRARIHEQYL